MSVSFLYPWAWLGALAVAAPIWLHLHRRREAHLVLFPTLRFLDDQPLARQSPLWPRHLLLLLVRVLAVLLLCAAFAWPYFPEREEPPPAVTDSTVYIFDNSLSHQAAGKWERARDALARRLESTAVGSQAALVVLGSIPRVLGSFGDDPAALAQKLRALSPSFARGSYVAALRQADDLLRQSLGQRRHIVWYGDDQENQWKEDESTTPFLVDVHFARGQSGTAPPLANLALWAPQTRRIDVGGESRVQSLVTLFHQGPATEAALEWRVNGEIIGERRIDLAGQPEVVQVAVEWSDDGQDWLLGEIAVRADPDALEGDNRVYFAVAPRRPGRVRRLATSRFLRAAISDDVLQGRWEVIDTDEISSGDAAERCDVLLLETGRLKDASQKEALLKHINAGGGALLVVDTVNPLSSGLLRELGLVLGESASLPPEQSAIRYFFPDHPLFVPFRTGELGDLSRVHIYRYYRAQSEAGLPLLFAADGEPVIWQLPARGSVLVATFAMDRTWTNWPLQTSFVPFLDHCLDVLRPAPPAQHAYLPGETCSWRVPSNENVRSVSVRKGDTVVARAEIQNGTARWTLPDTSGLYSVYYDDQPEPAGILEVNPSPLESRLTYTDPEPMVRSWIVEREPANEWSAPTFRAAQGESSVLRQRVWWWMLLSGMALLCVETAWLAMRKEK